MTLMIAAAHCKKSSIARLNGRVLANLEILPWIFRNAQLNATLSVRREFELQLILLSFYWVNRNN